MEDGPRGFEIHLLGPQTYSSEISVTWLKEKVSKAFWGEGRWNTVLTESMMTLEGERRESIYGQTVGWK